MQVKIRFAHIPFIRLSLASLIILGALALSPAPVLAGSVNVTVPKTNPQAGTINTVTITVRNDSGNTDTTFNGNHAVTVSGYLAAPDGTCGSFQGTNLTGTSTMVTVTFNNGVAPADLILNKATEQTIGLSVAGVSNPTANTLKITPIPAPAAAMKLTQDITAPPQNGIGYPFAQQPKITLTDAYGNICANDYSTIITASKNDTGAWDLTGFSTVTVKAGVAAFSDLGATNNERVTEAQLVFNSNTLTRIYSGTVTLPRPGYVKIESYGYYPIAGSDNEITLGAYTDAGAKDVNCQGSYDVIISGYTAAPDGTYGSFNGQKILATSIIGKVNFVSGAAKFKLNLNNAADQQITISVAGMGSSSNYPIWITPKPSTPKSLKLTKDLGAPTTNNGKFTVQPELDILDAYDNLCTEISSMWVKASPIKISSSWVLTGKWVVDNCPSALSKEGKVIFTDLGIENNGKIIKDAQLNFNGVGISTISGKVNLPAAKLPAPVFNLTAEGPYNTAQAVSISCPEGEGAAVIRYTTDANAKDETKNTWPLYNGISVVITKTCNLRAWASMTDWNDSDVCSPQHYVIEGNIRSYQPGDNNSPYSANRLQTAQNFRGDLSMQYNSATLTLGKTKGGLQSCLWLCFPNLIKGQDGIPASQKIVQAKLVLTLKEGSGNIHKPYGFKIFRITDPDSKGTPCFGNDGIRNGLDFQYRDHRPGMNIPWSDKAKTVNDILVDDINNPKYNLEDKFELIPAVCKAKGYYNIELDVSTSVQNWISNKEKNQGWVMIIDSEDQWHNGDQLAFYGATASDPTKRPHLDVTFSTDNNLSAPDKVENLKANLDYDPDTGKPFINLIWDNTGTNNWVRVIRKEGMVPGSPQDGNLVSEISESMINSQGLSDTSIATEATYYYAVFRCDDTRNYSKRSWVRIALSLGPVDAPSDLSAEILNNNLKLKWYNGSVGYADWLIIEKQIDPTGGAAPPGGNWEKVLYLPVEMPVDSQGNFINFEYTLDLTNPNFGFLPNTSYYFRIEAVNSSDESATAVSDYYPQPQLNGDPLITTPGFLQAPKKLTWQIISAGRVNLEWENVATDAEGIKVVVCGTDRVEKWSYPLASQLTSCSVTGLDPGTQYLIKVEAIRGNETADIWTEPITTTFDFKGGML